MALEVPQWLMDNLNSLDQKIGKTNEQIGTVISLINDLRVKEAQLQGQLDGAEKNSRDIDTLKGQDSSTRADIATIKVHLTNFETALKDLRGSVDGIKSAVESSKIEGAQLNTKLTVYVGVVSFVVAAIGSVIVALITKSLGG